MSGSSNQSSLIPASPPHGFGDDERSRFLRRRPPASTVRWVEQHLGEPVTRVEARRGGSSSAIHALTVGGSRVILRRYVFLDVIDEEPDIIEQEMRALRVLERSDAVTPEPIVSDEAAVHADVPALVMSCLPGRVDWAPSDLESWLRRLAEALLLIHSTPWRNDDGIRSFRPYKPESWEPPPWLRDPSIWDRAVTVFHAPPADDANVFINRDYHPGNVLFRRGKVTGVVSRTFSALASGAIILFLGVVFAGAPDVYVRGLLALVPRRAVPRGRVVLAQLENTLWWWLIGRLVAMAFIGVVTGVGLALLGVPLAFILGLLAALLSFIPNLGPVLSALPAILLGLAQGPRTALWVALLYVGVQMVESYVLDPIIDRKTIYLPPALTILAQLVLALFAGMLGVTLATPLTAVVVVLVTMLYVQDVLGREEVEVQSR